jgi:methyl-accepting chemotaxis protein
LRNILVGSGLLMAIIPVLILGVGSFVLLRNWAVSGAIHESAVQAKGLALEYEQFVQLHLQAVANLAAELAARHDFTDRGLTPSLDRTLSHNPAFLNVLVVDPTGKSLASAVRKTPEGKAIVGLDYSDRLWFKVVSRTRVPGADREVVVSRATGKSVLNLTAPIVSGGGTLLGMVDTPLNLELVQELANRVLRGDTGYAVVATSLGGPLAHRDPGVVTEREDLSKQEVWRQIAAVGEGAIPSFRGTLGEERLGGFATVPSTGWKVWVTQARAEVEEEIAAAYRPVLMWVGLALLGALGLAAGLAVTIVRPIQAVQATATAIAGGDLTQQAPEQGPAEVVSLARAFNQMAVTLRQLLTTEREGKARLERAMAMAEQGALAARVGQGDLAARVSVEGEGELAALGGNLNRLIEGLAELVSQIRTAAEEIAAATMEILAATTQQAAGVAEEVTAVQETVTTVDEVKQTTQLVTQKAQVVAEAAQRTTQVAQDGRRAVEESTRAAQEAKTRMEAIAERILTLSEQTQAIGEITATVGDLAEQSNLLAVNAAIEAAKAGEAGKGFAVVAAEVKSLAEQSKAATAQVRGILGEVQRATQAAVMAAEQGVKVSETGAGVAIRAGEAIRLLSENVGESAQAAQQILASAQQQVGGMDQVALAMHNIQQASTQTMASTRQVERAAQDLNELARRLQARAGGRGTGLGG